MRVDAKPAPEVPVVLLRSGFSEGMVHIVVEVDSFGELRDYIVLEASHIELVAELGRVIYQWNFHPPIKNGNMASVIHELIVHIKAEGSVVSFSFPSARSSYVETGFKARTSDYEVASWQDLDVLPEPIHVVVPDISKDLLVGKSGRRATFRFYIDYEGNVRIPCVWKLDGEIDDRALYSVQESLRQWRFAPPTVKSKPVVVRVAQVFDLFND